MRSAEHGVPAGGAGCTTIPDLFGQRVTAAPAATAILGGDLSLTYRELDARANKLARVLVGRGIGPETVVAVAYRRSPDLWVAVLAVLKAGAAYLPVDAGYPAERISFMLADSGAALLLTDPETAAELPELTTPELCSDDPGLALARDAADDTPLTDADRLGPLRPANTAYVIYTSGSTGRPKGVAVTHAGLASLLADHLDRLKVTADSRILQFASPSFDASVWEMCMGLLSGAAFVVVGPDELAAGAPLAETAARHRVTHVTLPPAVLAALPSGALAGVRTLVTAGEALTPELADNWSVGRRMINAYGPTETTVCATMSEPLAGDGGPPPIGRATTGSRVYVLDTALRPVGPGVIGELYVSGLSLARGYLGRPELTAQRFVASPLDGPGERMYRTGDLAEWNSDGDLLFHGRVDDQVKVRGFRIEPHEIEAVLAGRPGVEQAAVSARPSRDGGPLQLVAYVVPTTTAAGGDGGVYGHVDLDAGFGAADLRAYLARRLPDYMVPAAFVLLDRLPLTPNGKVDRAALPEPRLFRGEHLAPRTSGETVLAELFADVLGLAEVGVDEDFFALGGDSIQSIQVVSRARARGLELSARDVFECRTVQRLAGVADARAGAGGGGALAELDGGGTGWQPLLPVARWIRGWGPGFDRFLQAMLIDLPAHVDHEALVATLAAVVDRHDVLRCRLLPEAEAALTVGPPGSVDVAALLRRVDSDGDWSSGTWRAALLAELDAAAGRLAPADGIVAQFVWFAPSAHARGRLLVVLHHLCVDGVSWRILLPDLAAAWRQVRAGHRPQLPPATTSLRRWAHALVEEAGRPDRVAELPLWHSIVAGPDPVLGARRLDPAIDVVATLTEARVVLSGPITEALLVTLPALFRSGVNDALLAAFGMAVTRWRHGRGVTEPSTLIRLEGHGREESAVPGADLSRTVGWFTSVYPVRLDLTGIDLDDAFAGGPAAGSVLKAVKEHLHAIPDKGLGYGLLRHLNPETAAELAAYPAGQVGFNYLGRFGAATSGEAGFAQVTDIEELMELDAGQDPRMPAPAELDVNAAVVDGAEGPRLSARFTAPQGVLTAAEVRELAALWCTALHGLVRYAERPDAGGLTPADLPLVQVGQDDIDAWERRYPGLVDVWPTTPLQSGLLLHSLLDDTEIDPYQVQYVLHLDGEVEPQRMRRAGQAMLDRHPALRVAFGTDAMGDTVQLVLDAAELPWRERDLSALDETTRAATFEDLLRADLRDHFDQAVPPMLRLTLVRMAPGRYELVLTAHHVLFDGWSVPLLVHDLLRHYTAGTPLPSAPSFRDFLQWRQAQDGERSALAWSRELDGVTEPTLIAPGARPGASVGKADVPLAPDEARAVIRAAAGLGVTLNTVVQGAWGLLLGQLTGRQDVVFASTVAGRAPAVPEVDSVVGTFLNTLPVRVRCHPDSTLADLLVGLQARQAALMDHHHHGLAEIHRVAGMDTLFDTVIGFESFPMDRAGIAEAGRDAGVSVTGIRSFTVSHYPVTVIVFVGGDRLRVSLQYQQELFAPAEAERMAARLGRVLRAVATEPDRRVGALDLLDDAERGRLLAGPGPVAEPAATVAGLIAAQVAATPDGTAVVSAERKLTYRELGAAADALAAELARRGVGPESVVEVALPASVDLAVALLGAVVAGATVLPVDTRQPPAVREMVRAEAGPVLLLGDRSGPTGPALLSPADVPPPGAGHAAPAPPDPTHLALLSTVWDGPAGPRTVATTHRGLAADLRRLADGLGLRPGSRLRVGGSVDADRLAREILLTLATGGTVELPDAPAPHPGGVVGAVPSDLDDLLDQAAGGYRPDTVWLRGDVPSTAVARRLRESVPGAALVHTHFAAEAGHLTVVRLAPAAAPPGGRTTSLGTTLPGAALRLLGPGLRLVPPGAVGEVYVAGPSPARGYLGRPADTAARFVADPYGPAGSLMVRTGELARWTDRGDLEYLGRADERVVVRGLVVHPDAVRAALTSHPAVAEAVVVASDGRAAGEPPCLVVYVVPGGPVPPEELIRYAAERLPGDLVPTAVAPIERLPLRPDGRLDRAALPDPGAVERPYRAPRTPQERELCELVADVLGHHRVGVDDDFFELGGNSILATRLASRIRKSLGVNLPIREIFLHHRLADLSRALKTATASNRPRLRKMNRSGQ